MGTIGRWRYLMGLGSFCCCALVTVPLFRDLTKPTQREWTRRLEEETLPCVRKTVWSNRTRLIVTVGLEGTGHHFFVKLFSQIPGGHGAMASSYGRGPSCRGLACILKLQGNWNQWVMEAEVLKENKGLMPLRPGWTVEHLKKNAEYLKSMAQKNPTKLIVVNPFDTSWPNGHGAHAMRQSHMAPDMMLLTRAAEMADLDLRMIVMTRDPGELLLADCRHRRDLEKCDAQAQTLAENAKILAHQLGQIDPAFYRQRCVRYGDLQGIARGLALAVEGSEATLGVSAEQAVKGGWVDKHRSKDEAKDPSVHEIAAPIQPSLDAIADLCRKAEQPGATSDWAAAALVPPIIVEKLPTPSQQTAPTKSANRPNATRSNVPTNQRANTSRVAQLGQSVHKRWHGVPAAPLWLTGLRTFAALTLAGYLGFLAACGLRRRCFKEEFL